MSPYLSKVKAALGATGARVAVKEHGVRRIVEHLGSAHNTAELAALLKAGWQKIVVEQDQTPGPGTGAEAHRPEQRCGGGQVPGSVRESLHGSCTRSGWTRPLGVIVLLSRWFWLV